MTQRKDGFDEIEEILITHSLRSVEVAKKFAKYIIETSEIFSMSENIHRELGNENQAEFFRLLKERGISISEEVKEVFIDLRNDLDVLKGEYEDIVRSYGEMLESLGALKNV